ncbi:MAG TPA: hypothetical protein VH419_10245 [Nocardioidaceae bacterium]|jgi:membrane peptidoglycan carboxypeptidase
MTRVVSSAWIKRGLYALGTGLVASGFTAWLGLRPRPVLVVLVTVSCFAVGWLLADLAARVTPVDWVAPRHRSVPRRGLDPRFSRLARKLRDDVGWEIAARDLHTTLVSIVDERLAAHHGIDRRQQPAAAQAVLGEELSGYIEEAPRVRRGQAAYVSKLLTRIEAL